jgi:hypothetical protein
MVKVQFYIDGMNAVQLRPYRFSDDLSHPLIIPATGASKIPFGMVSQKFFHLQFLSLRALAARFIRLTASGIFDRRDHAF